MTTARTIISGALRFGLNRLSPGETLDADTADVCLEALNSIVDEINGHKAMLWREVLTAGTVTAATGTLGTTWATLAPGAQILGATYSDGTQDIVIQPLTMQQYHEQVAIKTLAGQDIHYYAHDGAATVYFYPVPTSRSVTLRTMAAASAFADLDTDYTMPAGYRAAFEALLAERMAPTMVGDVPATVARRARAARMALLGFAKPAIIEHVDRTEGDIFAGR